MTILLIHNYYQQRGGEDSVFEIEAEALKRAGHTVIQYTRHNRELNHISLWQKLVFPFTAFKNRAVLKDLEKILDAHVIEVAHIHNVFPLITPHVYQFFKKRKIKVVQTIHNYRFLCPAGQLLRDNRNCMLCKDGHFFYCFLHRCYKKSYIFSLIYALVIWKNQRNFRSNIDAYITLTDFPRTLFIEQGYDGEKIFVKDNASQNKPITSPQKKRNYFLFLGRLSEEKGFRYLLDTFKKLPNQTLLVAGTGENYEDIVEKYESTNIKFKGFVSGEEKTKLVSEAIALIVPSIWNENYPISLVEAFNYGTPVIGSDIGGIPFIIQDGHDGFLFEPNNQRSLIEKILLLAEDKKMAARMSKNAKDTFLSRMEISANIQKLEAIYRTLHP